MTRTPAPALSAAEAARVAAFDAAPVLDEAVLARVAVALELACGDDATWLTLAAAAIAALPPSPAACGDLSPSINFGGDADGERLMCELPVNHGGAHQHGNGYGLPPTRWIATGPSLAELTVKRVEALVAEWRRHGWQMVQIDALRAALASPAPAPQGDL